MSRTIWKITLPYPGDLGWFSLPSGARLLSADVQNGVPVGWVEVDTDVVVTEDTAIHVVGTGWEIPENMYGEDVTLEHRATFQDGAFVWHVLQGVQA